MSIEQGPSFRSNESIAAFVTVAVNASTTLAELRVEVADTSTSIPVGISQDASSPEGSADVRTFGFGRMLLATTTAAGDILTWQTATGQGMPVVAANSITVRTIAVALAPGTAGSIIPVLISPQYIPNI